MRPQQASTRRWRWIAEAASGNRSAQPQFPIATLHHSKTRDGRDKVSKPKQVEVFCRLRAVWYADDQTITYQRAKTRIAGLQESGYDRVAAWLADDRDRGLTFFGFPSLRGHRLRTRSVVESPFGGGRLRTAAAKRFSAAAAMPLRWCTSRSRGSAPPGAGRTRRVCVPPCRCPSPRHQGSNLHGRSVRGRPRTHAPNLFPQDLMRA